MIQNQDIKSQNFLNIVGISIKYAAPEEFARSFLPNANNDSEDEKKAGVYSFAVWSFLLFLLAFLSCSFTTSVFSFSFFL